LALIVQSIASLTTGFIIAFIADWRLALVVTCVIPLVGAQGYAQVKFLKGFSEEAKVIHDNSKITYSLLIMSRPYYPWVIS
jgi:ATP-binding cassette, subfamily B (MDR/TAP), member 1